MSDAQEHLVRAALEGMRFPARHRDLMTYVIDRGGIEPDVLDALESLPARAFSGPEDVVISLPDRVVG